MTLGKRNNDAARTIPSYYGNTRTIGGSRNIVEIPDYAETRRTDIGQRVSSAFADGYAIDASELRRNRVTPIDPNRCITMRRHSRSDWGYGE